MEIMCVSVNTKKVVISAQKVEQHLSTFLLGPWKGDVNHIGKGGSTSEPCGN